MKVLKWFLILFAVCLLIVVAGVLYVLNSAGLQKSFVQGALEKQVTVNEFKYFKAGFKKVKIESLAVEKDGMIVGLDEVTLDYSLWDYLFGKEVRVENLDVKGLVVNMRGPEPALPLEPGPVIPDRSSPSEASPKTIAQKEQAARKTEKESFEKPDLEPFKGLFAHGVLPFKLYVGKVDVQAKVLLPGEQEANATLSGGGIEPGTDGTLSLTVTFSDAAEQAQLASARINGKLTLTQNADAALTRVLLVMDVEGDSPSVPDAPKLTLTADLSQQNDKTETYVITMAEADQPKSQLVHLDATFDPEGDHLKGTLSLTASDAQVAALAPQDKLPAFQLDGDVDFEVISTSGDGHVLGKITLVLDQLTRVREELAGLGQVTLTANLEATSADHVMTLKRADAGVASANQGQLLVLESLKQFSVKCDDSDALPELTGDLVRLTLNALPYSLVNPWLPGISLSGQPLSTQLLVSGEDDGAFRVVFPRGLSVADLSASKAGQPMLNAVTLQAQPTLRVGEETLTVDVAGLKLSQGGIPVAQGELHVTADTDTPAPKAKLKTTLSGDLAQLLKQPALSPYNNLASGTFETNADLDYNAGEGTFTLQAKLDDMIVRNPMKRIPLLALSAKGKMNLPALLEVDAPLVLKTSEGNTDLSLQAKLTQQNPSTKQFDVTLTGDQLNLDGVQLLAAAFKNPARTPASTTVSASATKIPAPPAQRTQAPRTATTSNRSVPADTQPFWQGYVGQASAKIGKIYLKHYRLDDATFQLNLTPDQLTIDPLAATFAGAPLKADTVIAFKPGTNPYTLNSTLSFSQFDVGAFLVQEKPGTTAPLTGMFDVKGTAHGMGPTMAVLLENVQGKFNLEGRDGNLRVLAAAGQQSTGDLAGFVLGGVSMLQKNKRTAVQTAQRLIQMLQDIEYDRFSIVAERAQNLDIDLSELALVGPEIRMDGTATVTYVKGTPIPQQRLSGQVDLQAKDDVAKLFSDLRLLSSGKPNENGYYDAFSFPLKGTLAQPDFSELNQKLMGAAAATVMGSDSGRIQKNTENPADGQSGANGQPGSDTQQSTPQKESAEQADSQQQSQQNAVQGLLRGLLRNSQ